VLLWRATDPALHRRQLDVTFPPRRLLEQVWAKGDRSVGVPRNVLESAERLRRELRPERGPVDWRPINERRRRAEARIQAVADYARERRCRRRCLVGYFGEALKQCTGCDRCGTRVVRSVVNPEVFQRLSRLRSALARTKSAWGGCPLEPDVLLALARCPPSDAAVLADVPGVGPALAERLGGAILGALAGGSPEPGEGRQSTQLALAVSLQNWRAEVARQMGVPAYLVLTDAVLREIAERRPLTRDDLARVHGMGPRTLAKFADCLLEMTNDVRRKVDLTPA
jgi:superfamily II DNA helicase RecQ